MSIALEGLREDEYRLGDYQAIRYDRARTDLFPDGYLGKLYSLCRGSARRSGDGILTATFGGNPGSDFDSIVSYLAQRPLVIMGEWVEDENGAFFQEAGFAFPIIFCGAVAPEKSCFAGYGFFKHVWSKPELPVLAMLGMAYMFQEWGVKALHGTRYEDNHLTWKFTQQFGFKEVGRIPEYQLRGGKLVPAVVTTLLRADFEAYVENFLVEQYRAAHPKVEQKLTIMEAPAPVPVAEPEPPSLSWL